MRVIGDGRRVHAVESGDAGELHARVIEAHHCLALLFRDAGAALALFSCVIRDRRTADLKSLGDLFDGHAHLTEASEFCPFALG